MLFQGRDAGQGVGGEVAGAQVAEGGEFLAELEEALFGADGARAVLLSWSEEALVCAWFLGGSW